MRTCFGFLVPNSRTALFHRNACAVYTAQLRRVQVIAKDADTLQRAFRPSFPFPALANFQLSQSSAVDRFEEYQRQECRSMHAKGLLQKSSSTMRAVLMPFWTFDVEARVECQATLAFPVDRQKPDGERVWTPMEDWKLMDPRLEAPRTLPYMQVYASYEVRRDLAEGAKGEGVLDETRPLLAREALEGYGQQVAAAVQAPQMRQCIAWLLAYRQLKQRQIDAATSFLLKDTKAVGVRDVRVHLEVTSRRARLVWLPAYLAEYEFGQKYSGLFIVPQRFQALIGGTNSGSVIAEPHYSPRKAQIATGVTVAGTCLAAAPFLGPQLGLGWSIVDALVTAAFWGFVTASLAGVVVRQMPSERRNQHLAQQARAEVAFYSAYDAGESGLNTELSDEHLQWLWSDADWRKWGEEDPWNWQPHERKEKAEELWKQQAKRRLDRVRFRQKLEDGFKKEAEDWQRDSRRQRLYGSMGATRYGGLRGQEDDDTATGSRRRPRRDFLGYYRQLGLDGEVDISEEAIKSAFKRTALVLHPDRNAAADPVAAQRLKERFHAAQTAYEVLRDPERRRQYDRGQLVQ